MRDSTTYERRIGKRKFHFSKIQEILSSSETEMLVLNTMFLFFLFTLFYLLFCYF